MPSAQRCSPQPPAHSLPFSLCGSAVLSPAPGQSLAGVRQGLGARRIHSCAEAGAGAIASHPGRPPNGSGGGSPSAGPVHPASCRQSQPAQLFPTALPAGAGGRPGSRAACPTCATLPEAAKPRGDCGPHPRRPGHGRPWTQHRAVHSGSGGRGSEGASLCKLLALQLPVTPRPTFWGQEGKCSHGALSSLPQITVCVPFSLLTTFFHYFSFFLKKTTKKTTQKNKNKNKKQTHLCGPSIVTPTIPKRGQGVSVSFFTMFFVSPNIFFNVV